MKKLICLFLAVPALTSLHGVESWMPKFEHRPVTSAETSRMQEAMPVEAFVTSAEPRRVLVYSATAGFRHGSIPVGLAAMEMLGKSTGAFSTVISDDPANFENDRLKGFDAVILLNTTGDFFMPHRNQREEFSGSDWEALQARNHRLVDNLVAYVKGGGGLVGIHSATDSCYNHDEYGLMIGGYFHGHPWNAGHNVIIRVEDQEHRLNQLAFGEMEEFAVREEIYQFRDPYSRERLRILLNLDVERSQTPQSEMRRDDGDYAVAWVQKVDEGRVFYSSLGHNEHIYWHPEILKHFLAGIQYAIGDLEADATPSSEIVLPSISE